MPADEAQLQRLLAWLRARGFELTLWGEPVSLPATVAIVRDHYYLRALRRDPDGRRIQQLDLSIAD